MNTKDVSNALKSRLTGMDDFPAGAWPNVDLNPGVVPRFEVVFSVRRTEDPSLKGGSIRREEGTMRIVICTPLGEGEDAALDYYDGIRARFPKGLRVPVTGGEITVKEEPTTGGTSYSDKSSYRLSIAVRYCAVAH